MYKIVLPNFEGPLDLLLYFIKRDELNIYDIPIARITEEFLKYIRLIQMFDLELAGEFLVMAANLMIIKAQMLLPSEDNEIGEDIEDPRTKLVQQLLEYKKYKEAANELNIYAEDQKYAYYRQLFDADYEQAKEEIGYTNATLMDLLKAFQKTLDRAKDRATTHTINLLPVTVDEKSSFIMETLKHHKRISFMEITKNDTRQSIVVTFLAILDLIKTMRIIIIQNSNFEDIIILQRKEISLN